MIATGFVVPAIVAMHACASLPQPQGLDRTVPPAWRDNDARADAQTGAAVPTWWSAFGDPDVEILVASALRQNLSIAALGERVRAARLLAAHARDPFRPTLSISAAPAVNVETTSSFYQAGFDARWELGLFGKEESSAQIITADADLAGVRAQGARVTLVADVIRAYVGLRAAGARLDALDQALAAADRIAGLTRVLFRARQVPAVEVSRALDAGDELRSARAGQLAMLAVHAQQLALLTGQTEVDPRWLAERRPLPLAARLEATPSDLLRFRPDIAEAEQQVIRAAGDLGVARAAMYPSLSLTGALGYSVRISGTSATALHGLFAAGPVLDVPLFDWGLRRAVAAGRAAELQAAVLTYRQSVLEGYAEAQSAISEFTAQGERVAAARAILERRVREAGATEQLAMTGHASQLDAWMAQSRVLAARVELGNCEEASGNAFIAFYKAIGGAPPPDPLPVG